jgi:hypothetical protein
MPSGILHRAAWGSIAEPVLRACEAEILYGKYRQDLPDFPNFLQSAGADWFPSQDAFADLTRSAAHMNTAQAWWQIQNTFWETAHLMAHARAYQDIEAQEADEERRLLVHLTKLQFFNLAAHLICKVEDWFLLLLFVNSGASLIPTIDVHKADWPKEITRKAINEGLKLRKSERFCGRFRKSNPYLDALADEDYRTIRSVCRKLGRPRSVGTIREYRNEIAHRGLPAVDYPFFSPQFRFPKKEGQGTVLGIGGGATVKYKFLELYDHAIAALKHLETQLLRIKSIPVFAPG